MMETRAEPPEVNHFSALGLKPRLGVSAESVREKFQMLSLAHHPDADSGDSVVYDRIVAADAVLRDRSRRIAHWLALYGVEYDPRAVQPSAWVAEEFGDVASMLAVAGDVVMRRGAAGSALGRAVIGREVIGIGDRIAAKLEALRSREGEVDARLREIDAGDEADIDELRRLAVDAGFVARWIGQLRAALSSLV